MCRCNCCPSVIINMRDIAWVKRMVMIEGVEQEVWTTAIADGAGISECVAERALTRFVEDDECLIFTGELDAYGYGVLREQRDKKRRKFKAHRVAWAMVRGPIPDGQVIMHTCDRPACIKPEHLRLGIQQENLEDCRRKGRARGRYSRPMESEPA